MSLVASNLLEDIESLPDYRLYGRVTGVTGIMVEVGGLEQNLAIGARCLLHGKRRQKVYCEVIGFRNTRAIALPFGSLEGIGLGCKVELRSSEATIHPSALWLGRVVNALGEPIDNKGRLPNGSAAYPLQAAPPPAHLRRRVGQRMDLGVKAINAFLTCCEGQRMGIFAGSGVGKSLLLSMLARFAQSDVNVIGLIGERGREVQEWLEKELGPEGLARSVVIVATSDESPLMRRQAAQLTLTIAEYFRDQGKSVLCLMDSVTRFAMAMREIGLAAGEPPATKGYTPSVFAELPRLLERAGPGRGEGSITGLFTVLVEGDDHNEPISDSVRGILDGHIMLDRQIAERNRYPAINVLRSISRTMPACNSRAEIELLERARRLMSGYEDMSELIRIGAYKEGSNAAIDEAIHYFPRIESFLGQEVSDHQGLDRSYAALAAALDVDWQSPPLDPPEAPAVEIEQAPQEPNTTSVEGSAGTAADRPQQAPLRVRKVSDDQRKKRMAEALNLDPETLDGATRGEADRELPGGNEMGRSDT